MAQPIPSKADPRWAMLVTNGPAKPIKLLALKFMLARMSQEARRNAATVGASADELWNFFNSNERILAADAATLFQ